MHETPHKNASTRNARPVGFGRAAVRAIVSCVIAAGAILFGGGLAHSQEPGAAATEVDQAGDSNESLTAADRDFLVKVRLAGLWETPAGLMAVEKGVSPRVREIGQMIGSQHRQLDALVVQAAAELGVPLPDEPNADQTRWLEEMRAATGAQFDYIFVDRLRVAHGKVFSAVANIRAGTRNAVVRRLAQSANGFVLTHMTLLESTGLVDYTALPLPPQPLVTGNTPGIGDLSGAMTWILRAPPWLGVLLVPITVLVVMPRIMRLVERRRPGGGGRPTPARPTAARPTPVRLHTVRRLRDNPRARH